MNTEQRQKKKLSLNVSLEGGKGEAIPPENNAPLGLNESYRSAGLLLLVVVF